MLEFHKNNRMQPLETDTKKYVNERVVLFKNSRKIEDNYVLLEVVMENKYELFIFLFNK